MHWKGSECMERTFYDQRREIWDQRRISMFWKGFLIDQNGFLCDLRRVLGLKKGFMPWKR